MKSVKGLPNEWQRIKIGDICQVITGTTPPKTDSSNYGSFLPFFKPPDLWDCEISSTEEKLSEKGAKKARVAPAGTVLVTCIGNLGRTGYLKEQGAFNQQINAILANEKVLGKYLFYQAQSPYFKKQLESLATGTTVSIVNKKNFQTIEIPLPPISTQYSIVSKIEELFSELDKSIENLRLAQQQLKTYRQAVLKWAFEGRLTEENPDVMPKGWKKVKLKDITLEKGGLRRGPFGSAIKKEFFVQDGYKVYEQGNAINNDPYRGNYYVSKDKYNELFNFNVAPRDLIVSCSGVTLGRICEIPLDAKPGIINQALLRIRLKNEIIINKYFVIHFRSALFQRKIFDQSQGTAMPNLIGIKDFKEIEMMLPPVKTQSKIVQEIEARFKVADIIEDSISKSMQKAEILRKSVLKKAFIGKL